LGNIQRSSADWSSIHLAQQQYANSYVLHASPCSNPQDLLLLPCRHKHTALNPEDLNKVVVHYGHVFPFRWGKFGCMALGYDIYCPGEYVSPDVLVHEVC
jgi:hypothetical protein